MLPNKIKVKKATRFALLFYSIFMGGTGTVFLLVLIFWGLPKDQLYDLLVPLSIMFIPLYGTCIVALIIRAKFFKKEGITSD
jgi:hypothetical protein